MEELGFLAYLCEGMAAVCGFYYFRRTKTDTANRYFAYFLLFTFLIESVGHIPIIIYRNESLYHLKETYLGQNYWLFNPYLILSFLVYINYFKTYLSNAKLVRILNVASILYFLTATANFIFSDVLFSTFSAYTYITGTLLLLLSIAFYYFELLTSERILLVTRKPSFYISVAALLYYLCTTPFFIYFKYYNMAISPEFVQVYTAVSVTANIFMYTCFAIGFIICSRKNNFYSSSIS